MHKYSLVARIVAAVAVPLVGISAGVAAASTSKPDFTTFSLFPQTALVGCMTPSPGSPTPQVEVKVNRNDLNDEARIELRGFRPGLDFDLFTIQHSPQTATGTPDANPSVGLATYQSDLHVDRSGMARARISTILLDEAFSVDKDVSLAPTNTFHLGFWFDNPADAGSCGFTGSTPFNGQHTAGPLAFVTRPDGTTNLGPLCTDPIAAAGGAFTCNP